MGIESLNEHIQGQQVTISDLRGKSFVIDGHTFLHKAAQEYSRELIINNSIKEIADQVGKWILQFLNVATHVIVVFDGGNLPAKRPTYEKRQQERNQAKIDAQRCTNTAEEAKILQEAIGFSFDQVKLVAEVLIKKFQQQSFYCFLAPFEADAQLAFLNACNLADVVVTLDSDIYLYGVEAVLFNYNFYSNQGKYVENCENDLFQDIYNLRKCAILSGCDYISSLKGVGLLKAQSAVLTNENVLKAAEDLLKGKGREIPEQLSVDQYFWRLLEALFVFQYMRVLDPVKGTITMLHEVAADKALLELFGDAIGEEDALAHCTRGSATIQWSLERLKTDLVDEYIGQASCQQLISLEKLDILKLQQRILSTSGSQNYYFTEEEARPIQRPDSMQQHLVEPVHEHLYKRIQDAAFLE